MRELNRVAPAELDAAMVRVSERTILPAARSLTPRRSGALAASTRVVQTPKGVAFTNPKVYANVQHFGGQTWHARSGPLHSVKSPGPGITGKRFITRAVEHNPAFDRAMLDELEALVLRHL